MLKTVMIDDEEKSRESFKWMVEGSLPDLDLVAQAEDVPSGMEIIEKHKPDVVFLDVQLNDETGFDLLRKVKFTGFDVVFITAYDKYALEAFKVSAIDFLVKPVSLESVKEALKKIVERRKNVEIVDRIKILIDNRGSNTNGGQKIVLPIPNGFHSVLVSDIVRCESDSNYTTFHYRSGENELVCRPLKDFEALLVPFGFMRVHRSTLINLDCVTKYNRGRGGIVSLVDGSTAELARSKREEFVKAFLGDTNIQVE